MDDTIFVLDIKHVGLSLKALNMVDPHIKFTAELEDQGKLNFLNLTLHRVGNCLVANWYKKALASNRILNYYSSHKRSTIMNTATQFIRTVLDSNDADFFQANKAIIEQTLMENCFPECVRIMLMQENYTPMKFGCNTDKNTNAQSVSFPHQLLNGRVKSIRNYKTTDAVLTESIKNNKINHIRNVKTITPMERRTNLILRAVCLCGQRVKIEMTKFNQTGAMLKNIMLNSNKETIQCRNNWHVFREICMLRV